MLLSLKRINKIKIKMKTINTILLFSSWMYVLVQLIALMIVTTIEKESIFIGACTVMILFIAVMSIYRLVVENNYAWHNRPAFRVWGLVQVLVFTPLAAAIPAIICHDLIKILCDAGMEVRPMITWDVFIAMNIFMIQLYRKDNSILKTLGYGK